MIPLQLAGEDYDFREMYIFDMHKLLTLLASVALLCSPQSAFARALDDREPRVVVDVPEGWTSEERGEFLFVASPDDELVVVLTTLDPEAVEQAVESMGKELEDVIEDLVVTRASRSISNGIESATMSGTGTFKGEKLHFTSTVTDAGDACLAGIALGKEEALKKHRKATMAMLKSLRREAAAE